MPWRNHDLYSAVAVKRTSQDELSAVSILSCTTPMIKPTPTTCIEMSFEMPKSEQAMGIKRREPPATPEAPHAPNVAMRQRKMAVGISTEIPRRRSRKAVQRAVYRPCAGGCHCERAQKRGGLPVED